MIKRRMSLLLTASALSLVPAAAALASDAPSAAPSTAPSAPSYAYATNGIKQQISGGLGSEWKLLVDPSNLGGQELDMVQVTLPAGTVVGRHTHRSVEIIYVLSGVYEHEVNGTLYRLTRGMVGIVRPGDHVRHMVPKSGPAKLLIIWAPAGEAERLLGHAKGVPVRPLRPVAAAAAP